MQGSLERVRAVLDGRLADRAPLYDLLRNDAVIKHFSGQELTVENAPQVVYSAYEPAVDATRPLVRLPEAERTVTLEDGRQQRYFRWTIWTESKSYSDTEAYVAAKRRYIDTFDPSWNEDKAAALRKQLAFVEEERERLGEVFYFASMPGVGLQSIYGEVGLEQFSYYLADCPGLIDELLECHTLATLALIEHLPADHTLEAVFTGDDIAFQSGPFMHPRWFATHYTPRMTRVVDAYHAKGIKVLFHSDGDLNPILDQLVDAGIDGLNPIEVLAHMDVGEIHRRYPELFMAGGIDVSQLLPFGKPGDVYDTVCRTLDAAGGRILVGSTTELNNDVPLENYLALRQAVFDHPYR
jgi:hypothetical protein